jgi:hypothetical protein
MKSRELSPVALIDVLGKALSLMIFRKTLHLINQIYDEGNDYNE